LEEQYSVYKNCLEVGDAKLSPPLESPGRSSVMRSFTVTDWLKDATLTASAESETVRQHR
jgi:hypothetical protein